VIAATERCLATNRNINRRVLSWQPIFA